MSTVEIIAKASKMLEKMEGHLDKNCSHCRELLNSIYNLEDKERSAGEDEAPATDITNALVEFNSGGVDSNGNRRHFNL